MRKHNIVEEARPLDAGMGVAVARRTVFRPEDNEDMARVARRVALGNLMLAPEHASVSEEMKLRAHIAQGGLITSGRHLQHGDAGQVDKTFELFSNCSVAALSFIKFYLLLNGSGVGRSYDDAMMVVDWAKAPKLSVVLSPDHPDVPKSREKWFQFGKDFKLIPWDMGLDGFTEGHLNEVQAWYLANIRPEVPGDADVYVVEDSREGWAKGLEIYESMAFAGRADTHLALDFSKVRPLGSPIAGMQNRPASGPLSVMRAFINVRNHVVGKIDRLWEQAMHVDHYFSVEVQVGGARRAARMATKDWRDPDILDFIRIKERGGLWTSNNSVMVDQEFWHLVDLGRRMKIRRALLDSETARALEIFDEITRCSYVNGEPGTINGDKLDSYRNGRAWEHDGATFGSRKYQVGGGQDLLKAITGVAKNVRFPMITNPCVPGDTQILTDKGHVAIRDMVGRKVKVWNGIEFSEVEPFSTGVNEVYRVELSDGTSLTCTGYHKWVLADGERVDTLELNPGDKLAKFDMPVVIDGEDYPVDAYSQGFYAGDGSAGYTYSWVYAPKFGVIDRLIGEIRAEATYGRTVWNHGPMLPKAFVPVNGRLDYCLDWLAGLLDADGTVTRDENGNGLQISSVDGDFLREIRLMLTRLGVRAKVVKGHPAGLRRMPDGLGGHKLYECRKVERLLIGNTDTHRLVSLGLDCSRLEIHGRPPQRDARQFIRVVSVEPAGACETFCFNEPKNHTGTFNGIVTGQCGEIELHVLAGYCVLADVAPINECPWDYTDTLYEPRPEEIHLWDGRCEEAVRLAVRFLMRVNLMDSLYKDEVERTNRIGVSLTGVHEWAWARYFLAFRQLIDEDYAFHFWKHVERLSQAAKDESRRYAAILGVAVPHTVVTIKPAGTTSKLYSLSEGAHLPARRQYIRWVQFRGQKDAHGNWPSDADPILARYEAMGYPVRSLETFDGMSIVGFPTIPLICRLGLGDKLVTASEATPEEQYRWLKLMEKYWLGETQGNQISYTLKINTREVSLEDYREIVARHQPEVRCCTILPTNPDQEMNYEYLPEEEVSLETFQQIVEHIQDPELRQDVDLSTLLCTSGACPL